MNANKSTLADSPVWALMGLLWLATRLPFSWQLSMGRGLGGVLYRVLGKRRKIAARNLALCFPNLDSDERELLLRRHFASLGMGLFETAMAWWATPARLQGRLQISGLEEIQKAQVAGKGIIVLSGHFTTMELIGRLLPDEFPLTVTYREQNNPVMDALLLKHRGRSLEALIHRRDVRGMVRAFRDNRSVWYAPDQDYGPSHSVFAPLFGVQAATITGVARLAKITGASVVQFLMYRVDDRRGHYRVELLPALENFPGDDDVADAQRINAMIETAIARSPEQYFWVHRRFKTLPPGETNRYAE